jgi:GNAT superfamily N-acetyltransferase
VRATSATLPQATPSKALRREPGVERVRLRDGSLVTIRAVTAEDEPALRSFLDGLCLEARRLRFFTAAPSVAFAAHLGTITDTRHCGLMAHDEAGVLVGHALYVQLDVHLEEQRAEVAVEVADHLHGRGLGTILVERLAIAAEQRGITRFEALVLCENRAMLDVFREGFDARVVRREGAEEGVEFLTSAWRLAQQRFGSSRAPLPFALA